MLAPFAPFPKEEIMMIEQIRQTVTIPALALRGITVFPNLLLHFDVGRTPSIRAVEEAMSGGRDIFLLAQRDLAVEAPAREDLFNVGTVAAVKQILRLPAQVVEVGVVGQGLHRSTSLCARTRTD